MKTKLLISLLIFCQSIAFSQDKKIMKIVKYIEKGKGSEAKEILDDLDTKPEYQSDIYYWYVRTIYYRNAALENVNSSYELRQARQSFVKLVEFDKKDPSKTFTEFIPQIKKDLYEGKNQATKSESNSQSSTTNQVNDGKTITLTQIGEGRTKDDAKYNALRNAIEQVFDVFISTNTKLIQDELVKDEIISISNGTIQKYVILSEKQLSDGRYSSTLNVTVSPGKIQDYCIRKNLGSVLEFNFNSNLIQDNLRIIEMQKINEIKYITTILPILKEAIFSSYDFTINNNSPLHLPDDTWEIMSTVTVKSNSNFDLFQKIFIDYLTEIKLSKAEIDKYTELNLDIEYFELNDFSFPLRSPQSKKLLDQVFDLVQKIPQEFRVKNEVQSIDKKQYHFCQGELSIIKIKEERDWNNVYHRCKLNKNIEISFLLDYIIF